MARATSFGMCQLCGARKSKGAMLAHVSKCLSASRGAPAMSSRALLLRVQPAGALFYWLDLAVRRNTKLTEVDRFLRHIWLECCGHLSGFYAADRREVSMNAAVGRVFERRGTRLEYVYDFGSSTELSLSMLGTVEANPKSAVQLVARNEAPIWPCAVCGKPATTVCVECASDDALYCADHAAGHECGEEMLLPVVNSPRMGVCGYTGEG
jgi:hypothetical protein